MESCPFALDGSRGIESAECYCFFGKNALGFIFVGSWGALKLGNCVCCNGFLKVRGQRNVTVDNGSGMINQ